MLLLLQVTRRKRRRRRKRSPLMMVYRRWSCVSPKNQSLLIKEDRKEREMEMKKETWTQVKTIRRQTRWKR